MSARRPPLGSLAASAGILFWFFYAVVGYRWIWPSRPPDLGLTLAKLAIPAALNARSYRRTPEGAPFMSWLLGPLNWLFAFAMLLPPASFILLTVLLGRRG